MTYEEIKKKIEDDYSKVVAARGKGNMSSFYLQFFLALEELHNAIGPFIITKEQFIEQIKYLEGKVAPDIYEYILDYCHDKLKISDKKL